MANETQNKSVSLLKKEGTNRTPFSVVEAYKHIRIHLVTELSSAGGNVVTISSPNAGEGKSTTAVNTAITLSQLNKKVLLVDADSRRSTIHKKLKIENTTGLMEVISGSLDFEDCVKNYSSYLDILTSGANHNNPSELYSSQGFDDFIAKVSELYDFVIIDTPPINIVSDALVIAQKCTGLLMIIRANFTNSESFKKAHNLIKALHINLLGTIINGVDPETKKYYKYGKYGKYAKYGYGKYGYGKYDKYGY
jgi:capsular exopolysaccharide synthesis family protein